MAAYHAFDVWLLLQYIYMLTMEGGIYLIQNLCACLYVDQYDRERRVM